jgi:hypothetical protein
MELPLVLAEQQEFQLMGVQMVVLVNHQYLMAYLPAVVAVAVAPHLQVYQVLLEAVQVQISWVELVQLHRVLLAVQVQAP